MWIEAVVTGIFCAWRLLGPSLPTLRRQVVQAA
jgi:hypothetical protein